MSESQHASEGANTQEKASALFAQLILQQTNMALMLLGKIAHPESGQTYRDIDAARLFIDQLEMLEAKTKGNLSKDESALLKQSLMNLRLAFVEAVEAPEPKLKAEESSSATASPEPGAGAQNATPASSSTEEEHRKKFTKKY